MHNRLGQYPCIGNRADWASYHENPSLCEKFVYCAPRAEPSVWHSGRRRRMYRLSWHPLHITQKPRPVLDYDPSVPEWTIAYDKPFRVA